MPLSVGVAEPSISISQFDANFNFNDSMENAPNLDSLTKSNSNTSIPILIEEPFEHPDYLEEPAAHSVEELLKATVDGSSAEFVMDSSW